MNLLDAMRYLATLAQHRHFGRAAEACHITQPALSNAVRALEQEFGVTVVRRGRQYEGLTPEGERVLASAHRMLHEREALRQELSASIADPGGPLVIACVPTAVPVAARLAARLRERHPAIRPAVRSLSSAEIETGLADLSFDLALGYVDRAQARGLVRAVMDGWRRPVEPFADEPGSGPRPLVASEWPEPLLPSILLVNLPSAEQSSVLVCAPFVGTDAADHPAGHLAAAVIGAGHSARLTQEIRIRRGLSYGVAGRLEQQRDAGLFITSAQTEHAHATDVAMLMQTQLLALAQQQPVGLAELTARRAALIGGFARQLDTTSGLVTRLGDDWAAGGGSDRLVRWPERLEAVSPAQVGDFARRHWPPERLRTVIVGPIDRVFATTPLPTGAMRLEASALVLDSPTLRR